MNSTFAALVVAAVLEVGGDAAMRRGLVHSAWPAIVLGAVLLVAYGALVNFNRSIDFGRVMGVYIAIFFLTSQLLSVVIFGERPSLSQLIGGGLIAIGGLVIQFGNR